MTPAMLQAGGKLAPRRTASQLSSKPARASVRAQVVSPPQQSSQEKPVDAGQAITFEDPEAKFRRYGKDFGGIHKLDLGWLDNVPRVRVRTKDSRQLDELVELAVLNERLAGRLEPWQARQKLEYLRKRRKNWERIFEYVTKQDTAATLAVIEEANRKVEEALSEETRERTAVGELRDQLQELQQQVQLAQERLQLTQTRVEENLKRVNELKAQAMTLEKVKELEQQQQAAAAQASRAAVAVETRTAVADAPVRQGLMPAPGQPAISMPGKRGKAALRRNRGLESSLEFEEGLKNFWYPAFFSSKLTKDTLVPFDLFGEPWVLFRDEHGKAACIKDECAHRACPLSLGKVTNGQVQCPYHGWEFNAEGSCTKQPSAPHCPSIGVSALPCSEKDGFIWVWPGESVPTQNLPDWAQPPEGYTMHAEIMVEVPVEHGLLIENLLDLAHAPFTHTSTFARGWPVPDVVRFNATKMLSGTWDPYPITMEFHPPCMTMSTIGMAQPGKVMRGVTADKCEKHLHQIHACLPSKKGHTRLLYRMSMDFLPWIRHVPFIENVWKQVAAQVLGEDLVLVTGQQDRLVRGSNTWGIPAPYDKLAVRYRRWRNAVGAGEVRAGAVQPVTMTAGEIFVSDDENDL